jgi:hypothetical protein
VATGGHHEEARRRLCLTTVALTDDCPGRHCDFLDEQPETWSVEVFALISMGSELGFDVSDDVESCMHAFEVWSGGGSSLLRILAAGTVH